MNTFWHDRTALGKALVIFAISFVLALPLFFIVSTVFDISILPIVLTSAIGWFAGGAIVGTYTYFVR